MTETSQQSVSGIVLAGGRGSRMGFADKGLVELDGVRLIEHVIRRIRDDVSELIISCNRNFDEYKQYGIVVEDNRPGFPGPLAGILSAAAQVTSPICLVVPCDMPHLPENLCQKLMAQLNAHSACVVHDGYRLQPLVMLLRKS
ncbi:MAG: molybdenum cofactor guanylyltransferase, partial [Pseudomonadales bacterium]